MVTLSAADDMYDTVYLNNYATINIVDGLKRIPGVGNAEVLGVQGLGHAYLAQPPAAWPN